MHINFGLFADILRELAYGWSYTEGRYLASRSTRASGHRVAQGLGWSSETMTKNRRILAAEQVIA
ncbi:MAG: hypothetical protein WBD15_20195, partial [Pseudolabrys sp.]